MPRCSLKHYTRYCRNESRPPHSPVRNSMDNHCYLRNRIYFNVGDTVRNPRHMQMTLMATAAMLAASMEATGSIVGSPYESKAITGTKPNPDKLSKAEKKRERKNRQRLKALGEKKDV